jgi:hypothetical protein
MVVNLDKGAVLRGRGGTRRGSSEPEQEDLEQQQPGHSDRECHPAIE